VILRVARLFCLFRHRSDWRNAAGR
jgi:hypothetical protein